MEALVDRPPPWLLAAKVLLAGLLVVGAAFPSVGGFAGKGMLFRLPFFLTPALVIPVSWWWRRRAEPTLRYQVLLDAGLTLPFLFDTAANAVGLYDHVDATDDVLHVLNWLVLFGGVAAALSTRVRTAPRWLLLLAAGGLGAWGAIGWEIAEYWTMLAGPGNLHLTYADTLFDLALSSTGGFVGAAIVLRAIRHGEAAERGATIAS